MKIKFDYELSADKIELTEEELLENFIKWNKYDMFKVADKALSEVDWMNNRPKSTKLEYIAMLQKHIEVFLKDIDYNNDMI